MKRLLVMVLVVVLGAVRAESKVFTESRILCDQELIGRVGPDGQPRLFVNCRTLDSNGAEIRPQREYDVTSRMTAQQRNGLGALLSSIATFAAQEAAIPTPAPTSTP